MFTHCVSGLKPLAYVNSRYAGVRLYDYGWQGDKGKKICTKQDVQDLVDRLYEQHWTKGAEHPTSIRTDRRTTKRMAKQRYAAVADAVSACVCGLARWEELRDGA